MSERSSMRPPSTQHGLPAGGGPRRVRWERAAAGQAWLDVDCTLASYIKSGVPGALIRQLCTPAPCPPHLTASGMPRAAAHFTAAATSAVPAAAAAALLPFVQGHAHQVRCNQSCWSRKDRFSRPACLGAARSRPVLDDGLRRRGRGSQPTPATTLPLAHLPCALAAARGP